jgi:hypothetical protein
MEAEPAEPIIVIGRFSRFAELHQRISLPLVDLFALGGNCRAFRDAPLDFVA